MGLRSLGSAENHDNRDQSRSIVFQGDAISQPTAGGLSGRVVNDDAADESRTSDNGSDEQTVIGGEDGPHASHLDESSPWAITEEGEELRREMMLREVERIQRTNFAHFMLLCLVPTSLLLIVLSSVLGDDDACAGAPASCANEPRAFINAFTTRCICDAIQAEP